MPFEAMVRFIGYGPAPNTVARIVFLGAHEEAVAPGDDAPANWQVRAQFPQIADMFEAHLLFGAARLHNPFASAGDPVRVWNMMARVALAHEQGDWMFGWRSYWRDRLGRHDGDTALIECNPFPKHGREIIHPPAPWDDARHVWRVRSALLRRHFLQNRPRVLVAYGSEAGQRACDLMDVVNPVWLEVPNAQGCRVCFVEDSRIIHTPFFSQGQMNLSRLNGLIPALRLEKSEFLAYCRSSTIREAQALIESVIPSSNLHQKDVLQAAVNLLNSL